MKKRWKPDQEEYYIITPTGGVRKCSVIEEVFYAEYYSFGNCFKTYEDAEQAAKEVKKLLLKLHNNK